MREREFAVLDIPAEPPTPAPADASAVLEPGSKVRKLEDGFFSISGAAVDASGKLYFVDHHEQRIYGWSAAEGLTIERDNPLDPVNLAFDKAGNLLVLSSAGPEGTVYSFRPGSPQGSDHRAGAAGGQAASGRARHSAGQLLEQRRIQRPAGLRHVASTRRWRRCSQKTCPPRKQRQYVSPDGSVFLPAGRVFQQGPADSTAAGASPTTWTPMVSSAPRPASASMSAASRRTSPTARW